MFEHVGLTWARDSMKCGVFVLQALGIVGELGCSGSVERSADGNRVPADAGDGGNSVLDMVDLVCAAREAHGCGYADCRTDFRKDLLEFSASGCEAEYTAVLECTLRVDPCGSAPECREIRDRLRGCDDADRTCQVVVFGDGRCGLACVQPRWRAECIETPSGVTCTCIDDKGAIEFTAPGSCESPSWISAARSLCR
jgi:hypothetical protein